MANTRLTPTMPNLANDGNFSLTAWIYEGTFPAISGGGNLPKKAPSFSFFSGVSGGYLETLVIETRPFLVVLVVGAPSDSPFDIRRATLEPVGDEDLALVVCVAVSQDVGTLEGLFKVAKDVVDDQKDLGGI